MALNLSQDPIIAVIKVYIRKYTALRNNIGGIPAAPIAITAANIQRPWDWKVRWLPYDGLFEVFVDT